MITGVLMVLPAMAISTAVTTYQMNRNKKRREAMKEKDDRIISETCSLIIR
jgi:hypothetical protein